MLRKPAAHATPPSTGTLDDAISSKEGRLYLVKALDGHAKLRPSSRFSLSFSRDMRG